MFDLVNNAKVSGLWSVVIENWQPFTKWRNHLMARYTARSSLLNVLYFVSAGFSFLEKKATGHHWSLMNCCGTVPTALSDASLIMLVRASGLGVLKE